MLSIIIPIYNAERYLSDCLDSILNQSYSDFELLLIDDGSTDASGAICDHYAIEDSRILVIHQPNQGVSAARNKGIENAMGDWLYFMDADDTLKPDGLRQLLSLTSEKTDMIWAGYEVYDEHRNLTYAIEERVVKTLTITEALKNMYQPEYYHYQGYLWCKLFRRELLIHAGFRFNEHIYFNEDRLFVTQAICASGNEVVMTTTPVYNYYEHADSAMQIITQSYNPKFETDLMAYVLMQETIKTHTKDRSLHRMADEGIIFSYRHITGMQKRYRVQSAEAKNRVLNIMLNSVGRRKYAQYEFVQIINILRRKAKKILCRAD